MQRNVAMKFAEYVEWLLLWEHCKFGQKILQFQRYHIFLEVILFGAPSKSLTKTTKTTKTHVFPTQTPTQKHSTILYHFAGANVISLKHDQILTIEIHMF